MGALDIGFVAQEIECHAEELTPERVTSTTMQVTRVSDEMDIANEQSLRAADDVHVFIVDSGATSSFCNDTVPLLNAVPHHSNVQVADGKTIAVRKRGNFSGTTNTGSSLTFMCKHSTDFAHNLFSANQAVRNGYKGVLDDEKSYIECKKAGARTSMTRTSSGWHLVMRQD